jgi:hypothetical protein
MSTCIYSVLYVSILVVRPVYICTYSVLFVHVLVLSLVCTCTYTLSSVHIYFYSLFFLWVTSTHSFVYLYLYFIYSDTSSVTCGTTFPFTKVDLFLVLPTLNASGFVAIPIFRPGLPLPFARYGPTWSAHYLCFHFSPLSFVLFFFHFSFLCCFF